MSTETGTRADRKMNIYTHAETDTKIHIYVHTMQIHRYIYTHIHTDTKIHIYVQTRVDTKIHIYIHTGPDTKKGIQCRFKVIYKHIYAITHVRSQRHSQALPPKCCVRPLWNVNPSMRLLLSFCIYLTVAFSLLFIVYHFPPLLISLSFSFTFTCLYVGKSIEYLYPINSALAVYTGKLSLPCDYFCHVVTPCP